MGIEVILPAGKDGRQNMKSNSCLLLLSKSDP